MVDTTLVNFRLDQDTKRSMEGVCRDLGMSMTTAFTLFAKKVNRERRIPFDVSLDVPRSTHGSLVASHGINRADPAIIVDGVVRVYGEGNAERRALDGASFTVRRGEFVAITGASGSGKSTLLHVLAGVDAATSGRVVVDGLDLSTLSGDALALYRRHTVGLVYQFHNLVPFLTARDNVELPLRFDGVNPGGAAIDELLEMLDIADCGSSLPSELSGGQQQRVAIARALASEPAVVLADEPTGSLDRGNGKRVLELLLRVREHFDTTILLVTHDEEVASAADRTIRMSDGRIVSEGV